MQLTDLQMLNEVQAWVAKGESFWLCTILGTYGSAPRPVGSLFAWNGKQRLGSISGGCLEDAFIQRLDNQELDVFPQVISYGKDLVDEHVSIELPCGGSIRLLVEYYTPESYPYFNNFLAKANKKQPFIKVLDMCSNTVSFQSDRLTQDENTLTPSEDFIFIRYQQVTQLLILGISQVSEWVAKLGLMAGFKVKVCDMREELAQSWPLSGADTRYNVNIIWRSPDLFIDENMTQKTAVLALAHDPRIDDLGLMAALESDAFYIGAMGSKITSDNRLERLERIGGFSQKEINRLKAPIGLPIGSKTPFEIAVSIIADVIASQNGKSQ
ncbi:XdhC family protein [Vibrio sp. S4M6]|uniref:XdhC family protein n=1 Tax=Vibrio sinus TaxID=2946865 RepID=UPI002029EC46|nr:XdhC family protein [Vibrio sinus]MCL9779880.1 XdhC family protein [Vibrio sinus]